MSPIPPEGSNSSADRADKATGRRTRSVAHGGSSRSRIYLVTHDSAARSPVGPLDFAWVLEQLAASPDVTVEKVLRRGAFDGADESMTRTVAVAAMPESVRKELCQHPQMVVEDDLSLLPGAGSVVPVQFVGERLQVTAFGIESSWLLQLTGPDGTPVPGAIVVLFGSGLPAQGLTDADGQVLLTLCDASGSNESLRSLLVVPAHGFWSLWIERPDMVASEDLTTPVANHFLLQPLDASFAGFPQAPLTGWGQEAMRLPQVPTSLDGRGTRVAVVGSGAAALTHQDLGLIHAGADFTGGPQDTSRWTDDIIAHGSHCSGIIAGSDDGHGIRGFAPAAEVHELRIFPGGRLSSVLEAIDYCIDQQMDVVTIGLGVTGVSRILLQKAAEAKQQGVACIVAAGDSGDAVQLPGSSPDVLTVAAIGKEENFPATSHHANQRWAGGKVDAGLFAAQFSCHGPQVDLCAPGVAVVSAVPDNGYAAWDGTAAATAHVAGLATLVLAHHPDFQKPALQARTAARVDRLFQILRASATPLDLGDRQRSGAGLPDCLRALGLEDPVEGTRPRRRGSGRSFRPG